MTKQMPRGMILGPSSGLRIANNSWRFPVDNPQGQLPIDGAAIQLAIMETAKYPNLTNIACDVANWFDECRAAALGG